MSRHAAPAQERTETEAPREEDRPVAVTVRDRILWVTLQDGRVIGTPLEWYPVLMDASLSELSNVELFIDGVRWPDLDEDLSVGGMLRGNRPPRWRRGEWQKRLARLEQRYLKTG